MAADRSGAVYCYDPVHRRLAKLEFHPQVRRSFVVAFDPRRHASRRSRMCRTRLRTPARAAPRTACASCSPTMRQRSISTSATRSVKCAQLQLFGDQARTADAVDASDERTQRKRRPHLARAQSGLECCRRRRQSELVSRVVGSQLSRCTDGYDVRRCESVDQAAAGCQHCCVRASAWRGE